jgi:deoxyribonuclease V
MSWVALDVDYREDASGAEHAMAAAVVFEAWSDGAARCECVTRVEGVKPYVPGRFFERELPCLLAAIEAVKAKGITVDGVVVDAYVWLAEAKPGLGAHLWTALGERVPVVGVAKTRFDGAESVQSEVLRGQSQKPLYVTSAGIERSAAAEGVAAMHGAHRVPTLLARVDRLCREG